MTCMDDELDPVSRGMSSEINHLTDHLTDLQASLVRLLPIGVAMIARMSQAVWRTGPDYREICDCQRHARLERTLWRRTVRGARSVSHHLRRGTIALVVGVPLAYGAIGIPMDGMSIHLPRLSSLNASALQPMTVSVLPHVNAGALPIFTTAKLRQEFLSPGTAPRTFTIDVAKEEFFRTDVPFGPIIYREATRNKLAPELVAAVVEAESDFRPLLVSEKNARGLMQIIPDTGHLYGAEDLLNPSQNVAAGAKYLRYLCDRYGDERMALAAYNAGEGNVDKFGGVPPFAETTTYVRRVSARRQQYSQRVHGHYLASLHLRDAGISDR
jgi:hypothetical protein